MKTPRPGPFFVNRIWAVWALVTPWRFHRFSQPGNGVPGRAFVGTEVEGVPEWEGMPSTTSPGDAGSRPVLLLSSQ